MYVENESMKETYFFIMICLEIRANHTREEKFLYEKVVFSCEMKEKSWKWI